jgi:hypothetical protein
MPRTTTSTPVLAYGRAPARPEAGEAVRTLRSRGRTTVAVFPRGARRSDFISTLAGALLVAGVLTAATVRSWYHPVPLASYLAAVWPLGVVLLFFLGMLAVAYDDAYRQVEFEIDSDELTRVSFGPFGVRRRRWDRSAIRSVRVESHVSGTHPRVVMLTADGRRHDVLCPGAAGAMREDAERVSRQLSLALAL